MKTDYNKFSELCAAYVLGSLDKEDEEEFISILKSPDAKMREIYSGFFKTVALMNHSFRKKDIPAGLKAKILRKIHDSEASGNNSHGEKTDAFTFIRSNDGKWINHAVRGVRVKLLSENRELNYGVMILDVEPGVVFPPHFHIGAEESYVLEGDMIVAGRTLYAGDFHHADANSKHGVLTTRTGCKLLIIASPEDYNPPGNYDV